MLHHNHQLHTRDSVESSENTFLDKAKYHQKSLSQLLASFIFSNFLRSGGGRCKGRQVGEENCKSPIKSHKLTRSRIGGRRLKKPRGGIVCGVGGEMECVVVGSSSCCCSTSASSKAAPCLPSGRPSCATFVCKGRNSCPEIRLLLSTNKTQQRQESRRRRRGVTTTTTTTTRCSLSGNGNAMLHVMTVHQLTDWLTKQGFPEQNVKLASFAEEGIGLAAGRDLQAGDVALKVPENYTVTSADLVNHPVLSALAAGRDDLIGLTLWLMYERVQGEKSPWQPYLKMFPQSTLSPLLWTPEEQQRLLKGSPALAEVQQRSAALQQEHEDLQPFFERDPRTFPREHFSQEAFITAFAVIISRAVYLPTADLFALVPYADAANHRSSSQAYVDYSVEDQSVVLKVDRDYKEGEQVFASYGQERSNSDLLITYGFVDTSNSKDSIQLEVGLVVGDRLQVLKQQILQQAGLSAPQTFPLYMDRFPTQLLTYMRMSRLQDPALFSKIVFEKDIMLDQANEYEVLMILMGECRTRLGNYEGGVDDELRFIKNKKNTAKERVAAQLRLCEKQILTNTMAALRARLAPIRGIPTKGGGLKDPNADINEMFDMVEQVASAPKKFFDSMFKK